jgi:hypothetical protein
MVTASVKVAVFQLIMSERRSTSKWQLIKITLMASVITVAAYSTGEGSELIMLKRHVILRVLRFNTIDMLLIKMASCFSLSLPRGLPAGATDLLSAGVEFRRFYGNGEAWTCL